MTALLLPYCGLTAALLTLLITDNLLIYITTSCNTRIRGVPRKLLEVMFVYVFLSSVMSVMFVMSVVSVVYVVSVNQSQRTQFSV